MPEVDSKIMVPEKQEIVQSEPQNAVPTVAARHVGDVLPQTFYAGASQLKVRDEEAKLLKQHRSVPPDELEIKPDDGAVYAPHSWYENILTDVFGHGQWAIVPGSPVSTDANGEWIYQRWVLVVRNCYVAETIGQARYQPGNPRTNKALAAESARSDAIPRLCAKNSLSIGVSPWNSRFTEQWRREYAIKVPVQVWSKGAFKTQEQWRRRDAEPLPGEIQKEPEESQEQQTGAIEMEDGPNGFDLNPAMPTGSKRAAKEVAKRKTEELRQSKEAGDAARVAGVPVETTLFAVRDVQSDSYKVFGRRELVEANADLLTPFRNEQRQAYLVSTEKLDLLKSVLAERGIAIHHLKSSGAK